MVTSREVTMFVHGKPEDPLIRELNHQLAADLAEAEPVTAPYNLSAWERLGALVGKYVW